MLNDKQILTPNIRIKRIIIIISIPFYFRLTMYGESIVLLLFSLTYKRKKEKENIVLAATFDIGILQLLQVFQAL